MHSSKMPVSPAMVVVSVRWNGEPLAIAAGKKGEDVTLGEGKEAMAPLPEESLGCRSLVIADAVDGPHVCVPKGKVASITSGKRMRLVVGPSRERLGEGEEASVLFGAFEVTVGSHSLEGGKGRTKVAAGAWIHTAMVAAIHAGLLFAGSQAALASSIEESGNVDADALRGYLAAAEEHTVAKDERVQDNIGKRDEKRANGRDGDGKKGGGEKHAGEAGKAGTVSSRAKGQRWGAPQAAEKGNALPSADDLEIARSFGMVGVLATQNEAALRKPQSGNVWGKDDPFAAAGGMLGHALGDASGTDGLSLSGIGEGGGGKGEGIGLGSIGTIGHTDGSAGDGTGGAGTKLSGFGFGTSWWGSRDHWGRNHVARTPRFWGGHGTWVSGRLPAEAIQRVVRANFGRFRACFQAGLLHNPAIGGRVTAQFVIGRDGAVSSVSNGGSDMPDGAVEKCVLRAFYSLSFPQPEGGIVTVSYPIVFTPIE